MVPGTGHEAGTVAGEGTQYVLSSFSLSFHEKMLIRRHTGPQEYEK